MNGQQQLTSGEWKPVCDVAEMLGESNAYVHRQCRYYRADVQLGLEEKDRRGIPNTMLPGSRRVLVHVPALMKRLEDALEGNRYSLV